MLESAWYISPPIHPKKNQSSSSFLSSSHVCVETKYWPTTKTQSEFTSFVILTSCILFYDSDSKVNNTCRSTWKDALYWLHTKVTTPQMSVFFTKIQKLNGESLIRNSLLHCKQYVKLQIFCETSLNSGGQVWWNTFYPLKIYIAVVLYSQLIHINLVEWNWWV